GAGGTAANRAFRPSAIVGCVRIASRKTVWASPPSIAVCTAAMTSPASGPIIVNPRMRSPGVSTSTFMKPAFSPVVRVRSTALIGSVATRAAMPRWRASSSLRPTRASGGSVNRQHGARRAGGLRPPPARAAPAGRKADAVPGAPLRVDHVGREQDLDPFAAEDPPQLGRHVRILAAEKVFSVVDDGHTASEAAVGLGEFEADVSAAEDDEMLGQPVELEQLDVRERSGIRQAGNRWNRGMRPQVEEHALPCERSSTAIVQTHLDRLRPEEARRAHDQ